MEALKKFIDEWKSGAAHFPAHTSGSTGKPKEISLLRSDMEASARATNRFFGITSASVLGIALSGSYIAGKMMAVRALVAGARLECFPPSNDIPLYRIDRPFDLFAIVPPQINTFLEKPTYAARVRNLLIGGSSPSDDDCRRLAEAGYTAWISYGMTETCSHVALARADDPRRIFRAMPGVSFSTAADGRLVISCSHLSTGTIATNDVAELVSPTAFRWRGRADGIINSGGIKLIPEELESLYRPYMQGIPFMVAGVPDSKWGCTVALIAEASADTLLRIADTLLRAIPQHIYLPKRYISVAALPRTPNGKLRRNTVFM